MRYLVWNNKGGVGNTFSAVVNSLGLLPSGLQHQRYEVYGEATQVNDSQIQTFVEDIAHVLKIL